MPAVPFTFIAYVIIDGQVEVQTVVNEATNEQFFVSMHGLLVEVKRTRAPKGKEKKALRFRRNAKC